MPRKLEPTVRLNHIHASWSKVLKDYATSVQKQLVADEVPEGHFSRVDSRHHTPETARMILNRELEPLGFRLVVKRDFIVLIDLKQSRKEYQPAAIAFEGGRSSASSLDDFEQAAVEQAVFEKGTGGAPRKPQRNGRSGRPVAPAADEGQIKQADHKAARTAGHLQQVAGEAETLRSANSAAAAEESPTVTAVRLKARDAVAVSRIIYSAFKGHAEKVDEGPRGLPGFRVYRVILDPQGQPLERQDDTPVRFSIGIDENRNQLVVEASFKETPSVLRLIKMLDKLPSPEQGTVRAVPTSKDAGQIAEVLQPELDRLAVASRKAARRSPVSLLERRRRELAAADAENDSEIDDQETPLPPLPGKAMQPAQPGQNENDVEEEPLTGTLKGEVTVEAIPDLGIMVVIGNEKDVETVMAVIRQIERLSVGITPEVELVLLNHVSSDALASLLTSVYERLNPSRRSTQTGQQQQSQQNVVVIPVSRPNAILIVASKIDIDSVKDLAERLDQPSDPRTEYKVFRLKYAVPSQVVATVEAMYPPDGGQQGQQQGQAGAIGGLTPRVKIAADPRTNSVIVQARPRDLREVAILIRDLDAQDSGNVSLIKIFPLKAAVADELANTLQSAFLALLNPARITGTQPGQQNQQAGQGQGTGAAELREVKSTILEYDDEQGGRLLQSGILGDIRITADMRTNSIVVTATAESMELVEKLIRRFDQPNKLVAKIKVINMTNGDAQSTVTLLNGLFGTQNTQRTGQGNQGQIGQNFPGLQVANADDASSTLIPLRFSTDVRTNSVIAIGGADALDVVESIVLRLDESGLSQRKNEVYRLKNTPALDVATAITNFLTSRRQVDTADPGLVSPFEQIEREVIVVGEPVSNSLLISATPRFFDDLMKLVKDLDAEPKQVLIQALLVEVQLDNADEFGVELGLQDSVLFNRSLINTVTQVSTAVQAPNGNTTTNNTVISQDGLPGYFFNSVNAPLGNNTLVNAANPKTVGSQGLSNFNLGRINGDLGYGGLILSAGSESVSALLRAVAARRRVDVLSRPQIRALDNQQANIQVGQEVPRVGNFTLNTQTGTAQPIVEQRSIGIILQVIPRVTPEGKVVMSVVARKDALSQQSVPLFVNPNGSTVSSPIIDTTNALTTVSVQSGQTIVLGGMITKRDETLERKVPLLGDIPVLGQAFRYDYKRSVRTELLIFLTPRVVHNDAEAESFKEIETQRINFIEAEAEMMHGPLFGSAGEFGQEWSSPDSMPRHGPTFEGQDSLPPAPAGAPQTVPMSLDQLDDLQTPTTIMHGELPPLGRVGDEDLRNLDLSGKPSDTKRGTRRDSALVKAGFESPDRELDAPGHSSLKKPSYMPPGKTKQPPLPGPKSKLVPPPKRRQ
ncbi:MAG: hypothetical protein EXS05_18190 [Planctomycetaceae bacterium]|nr:hypothetical protein [Planctomycetaceae bacterium]